MSNTNLAKTADRSFAHSLPFLCVLVCLSTALAFGQSNASYIIDTVVGQHPLGHPFEPPQPPLETLLDRPVAIATAGPDFAFVYISDLESRRVRTFGFGPPNPLVRTRRSDATVYSLAFDADRTVYFGLRNQICVLPAGGPERLIEGLGSPGEADDGDETHELRFGTVSGLAVTNDGSIYFSDATYHVIRKVGLDGVIQTVAGVSGSRGYSGDGGPATAAQLDGPQRIAFDSVGNLYIADSGNSRIRRLSTDGNISTVAGDGTHGAPQPGGTPLSSPLGFVSGVMVDALDNLYFTDPTFHKVLRVSSDGFLRLVAGKGERGFEGDDGPAVSALLSSPRDLARGYGDTILIVDTGNDRIRAVQPGGGITTIAGASHFGGDDGPALSALLSRPRSVAVTGDGGLVIADTQNHRILQVTPDGTISTVAGNGKPGFSGEFQPATNARLEFPDHVALDAAGNVYFVDSLNLRVRRIGTDGSIQTVAGTGVGGDSGDGGPATDATFHHICGLAVGPDGWLYVSDDGSNRIRRFTPRGSIEAFAGTGIYGFSGDGGPAIDAELRFPGSLAMDSGGTLYLIDRSNRVIRSITPEGVIDTVAGCRSDCNLRLDLINGTDALSNRLPAGNGLAVDDDGNIFLSTVSSNIYKVETDGRIWTVVDSRHPGFEGDGGPAIAAELNQINGLAVDGIGNVYLTDVLNHRIRQLSPNPATSLQIIGGNNQIGTVGYRLHEKLTVSVTGSSGAPVPGVRVDLSVLSGDVVDPGDFVLTWIDGVGSFNVRLGATPSKIVIRASVEGLAPVDFELEAVEDPNASPPLLAGGVFGAPWSIPKVEVLSSGAMATVYGLDFFTTTGFHRISPQDLVDGKLPTNFNNTCVLINGQRAYIFFAGGPQLNVQVPNLGDATSAQVQVIRDCDLPTQSTPLPLEVPVQSTTPEFFYWSHLTRFSPEQIFPVAAVNPITTVRVGAPGLLRDLEFAPAIPGELVDIYATGFGATEPYFAPGELPDQLASVVGSVAVRLGTVEIDEADILYAGATQWAGVYLLRIRLPADLPAGKYIIRVTVDGNESPPGAFIEVGP